MCKVNGRVGHNDFTHVSHRGKTVVDYACVLYKQLPFVIDFNVPLMSDTVNALNCQGVTKIPEHSLLTWTVAGCTKKSESVTPSPPERSKQYNTSNILASFLCGESGIDRFVAAIDKIEPD